MPSNHKQNHKGSPRPHLNLPSQKTFIQTIRGALRRLQDAVPPPVHKKKKSLPVDGAMVMKMVWACFDRTDFAILGIVFVLYSVPVYFNPAGGSKIWSFNV
jgi:hypothetical protein